MEHRSLKLLRIAVIGTGALGSALLRLLRGCGVRDVLLVDPGRLEQRNFAMSPFLREAWENGHTGVEDSPPYKAALLARETSRQWGLPWRAMCQEIADVGWQCLAARDVLLCCTDSALSRAETAWTARVLGKPVIEAGVFGGGIPECRVSWFPPAPEASCYLCGMGEDRRAQVLAYAASASLGCAPLEDAPPMTGSPAAVERAAAGMLEMFCKFAAGHLCLERSVACRSRLRDSRWVDETLALQRSKNCPWHSASYGELVPLPWQIPLRESLHAMPREDLILQLPWRVCTLARCRVCGARDQPFARVALVRRTLPCPMCGARGAMEPLRSVCTVLQQDTLAEQSPRQLGQPEEHLYLVRRPVFAGVRAATIEQVTKS